MVAWPTLVARTLPFRQVVASLLVSVVLLGFKLSALKRLVQVNQRRTELKANLVLLQPQVEAEELDAWLDDVTHDAKQREDRIAEMRLSSSGSYSSMERDAIEKSNAMFGLFERRSASLIQRKHAATITLSETNQDPVTRQLFGHVKAEIRADSLHLVAFILNDDSRFMRSLDAADAACVRSEVVATVNPHHRVVFTRFKAPGLSDRTFLTSLVSKQVAVDPPTYVVAVTPIPSHENILPKDEVGAVRAELYKSFRCAEVAPGLTELDYFVALDLKGWVPQIITDTIALPGMLLTVNNQQRYFQQIRPLAKCDADDGRIVGQMLVDLVGDSQRDLSHAIRAFSYRTAMLRECSLRHIGAMLVRLLSTDAQTDAQGTPDEDAAIMVLDPSSVVTEKQATAIGSAIAACIPHPEPAEALQRVVKSHAALRAMQSDYIWFVPMLEVLTAKNSAHGRSFMKPLSSVVAAEVSSVVPVDVVSNAGGADEGSSFTSVVIATLSPSLNMPRARTALRTCYQVPAVQPTPTAAWATLHCSDTADEGVRCPGHSGFVNKVFFACVQLSV